MNLHVISQNLVVVVEGSLVEIQLVEEAAFVNFAGRQMLSNNMD